jgi:hypothetical protein
MADGSTGETQAKTRAPGGDLMANLGDMAVLFEPSALEAKAWKALAAIASELHPAYDRVSGVAAGASKDKCLFASLAIRDYLVQIGYRDATARSCALYVYADDQQGNQIWSVGIGVPDQIEEEGKFNGHAVVVVPSLNLMIDPTVYQAQRSHFGDLPGMIALPYYAPQHGGIRALYGLPIFAHATAKQDDRVVSTVWLDRPDIPWKRSEDYRIRNDRRIACTKAMLQAFDGKFKGETT